MRGLFRIKLPQNHAGVQNSSAERKIPRIMRSPEKLQLSGRLAPDFGKRDISNRNEELSQRLCYIRSRSSKGI